MPPLGTIRILTIGFHLFVPTPQISKKQQYLDSKNHPGFSTVSHTPTTNKVQFERPIFARNLHTHEIVILNGSLAIDDSRLKHFLRCWYTGNSLDMSKELRDTILNAARHFDDREILIVSAFRHPKYNLGLRKKGHQVARKSQHVIGQAVDFYLPHIHVKRLYRWLLRRHQGGVGFYPKSGFVHVDTGRKRTWRGD